MNDKEPLYTPHTDILPPNFGDPMSERENIQPRNSLVLVRLVKKTEEKVGLVYVKLDEMEYCEGEIIAVGRGTARVSAGGESECTDLAPGQRVLVQHKRKHQAGPDRAYLIPEGIDVGNDLRLFEQCNILAIFPETSKAGTVGPVTAN